MGTYLLQMFGISLLLTLLVEGIVALLWGLRGKKYLCLVILVNVLTNPVAVLVYWLFQVYVTDNTILLQILIEIVVVLAEASIYRSFASDDRFYISRPVLFAFITLLPLLYVLAN